MKAFALIVLILAFMAGPAFAAYSGDCANGVCGIAPVRNAVKRVKERHPVRRALGRLFGR